MSNERATREEEGTMSEGAKRVCGEDLDVAGWWFGAT
jgi:hypothetical protein